MLAGIAALAVAVVGVAVSGAADKDKDKDKEVKIIVPKDIAESVNKMADTVGKGDKVDKDAADFFKKHEDQLKKTMWVFKPREKDGMGGFGVGKEPGTYTPDGIEGIIITYSNPRRKPMSKDDLKKAEADFIRLAEISQAMAELTYQYVPKKNAPGKPIKLWTTLTDQMKEGAADLRKAVKDNDPDKTKAAFGKLYSSCTECHAKFRESGGD
jgi:cytochrome c556